MRNKTWKFTQIDHGTVVNINTPYILIGSSLFVEFHQRGHVSREVTKYAGEVTFQPKHKELESTFFRTKYLSGEIRNNLI